MNKIIHYCWFGGKPLPKLAKKCLKSWEKYLPDFEIKRWDESNCDINECSFVKEAYQNKKWAFVADYFRTKALNEYGGIYFDTDMEVTKNIDALLEDKTFLGIEDTGYVAVGVWWEREPKSILTEKLLEKYRSIKKLNMESLNKISVPILISECLKKFDVKHGSNEIQRLKENIVIYPRDYFYPLSYNHENNIFTDNTCMIHYYDASWVNWKQKLELKLIRKIGRKKVLFLEDLYFKVKHYVRKIAKLILFPIVLYRRYKNNQKFYNGEYKDRIDETIKNINNSKKKTIIIYNKYWMGTSSATKELFDNNIDCGELLRKKDVEKISDAIISNNINQVIFSAFAKGWSELIESLKKRNKNIKIKTFWHGNHSQVLDYYGWERNLEIISLHQKNLIDVMGTCKKSLMEFYKSQGFNAKFLTNKVTTNIKVDNKRKNSEKIKVGIYAAKCNDWRKNMYSQIAAVSLIKNAVIDMVPLAPEAETFAKQIGVKIEGEYNAVSREELMTRMAENDVNLYVTLSECAPMLPLESMELGVPCITGNNHHYFKNKEIEKYIVVTNETNITEIKEKMELCIKNKNKIIELYKEFSKDNLKEAKKTTKEFIEQ